jgi:membrane-bound ClpP family serine protease
VLASALMLWAFAFAAALPTGVLAQEPKSPSTPAAAAPTPAPSAVPKAIPAGRAAKNIAVITIEGGIDEWTDRSVRRRIEAAKLAGADAIVFDIDTPGGEMSAMLAISRAIKTCPIKNTVAWIHPKAYSAGAVIALACRETVVSDHAVMGDALPIQISMLEGIKPIPDAEREKILGPVMADLIESARTNDHDEVLVQGFVRRGVELWLVEHKTSGRRLFVTAEQFEAATGQKPIRGIAQIPSVTGSVDTSAGSVDAAKSTGTSTLPDLRQNDTGMIPASPNITPELVKETNLQLSLYGSRSQRPDLTSPEHAGMYVPLEYVASGAGLLTFNGDDLIKYRLAQETINSETELAAYFGAAQTLRLDETWSEVLARFLDQWWIKGLLVVVFLVALFVEMTHPGVFLPGVIAVCALAGLVLPPLLVNMAAWWMVGAIGLGIVLILTELFILPGTFVVGGAGALLLFGGLIGAVVGGPQVFFAGSQQSDAITWGLTTMLISLVAAGGVIFLLAKHLPQLPVFNRLVLKDTVLGDDGVMHETLAGRALYTGDVARGTVGTVISTLRPAGRAQFGDKIVDVVADMGVIDAGTEVRVVSSDAFRTVVERA